MSKKPGSLIPILYSPGSTENIHPNSLDISKKTIKKQVEEIQYYQKNLLHK
jgi:hypothetical protein